MSAPLSEPTHTRHKVADAIRRHWTDRLPEVVRPYAQIARWDRPIGWWLLLWPCWWSLTLALGAAPPQSAAGWLSAAHMFVLFFVGAVAMRGAGCTWNDITDRDLDAGVARTRSRPIPAGRISLPAAFAFLGLQLLLGLAVLLQMPTFAIALGFASVPIVVAYPFAKRVTDWPQLVLGLAFSWGALMGWAVHFGALSAAPLMLYGGAIAWTVGYDTIYAHQDREDDAIMGVRSTARRFGSRTKRALVPIYGAALLLFGAALLSAGSGLPAWLGLFAAALHMGRQIIRLDIDDAAQCLELFRSNTQIGWIFVAGLGLDLLL